MVDGVNFLVSLAAFQQALALLLTDCTARDAFAAQPEGVGALWQLSPDEISALKTMAAREIPDFAQALQNKRRGEVGEILPQTRLALGAQFQYLFAQYAAHFVPTGINKPRDDALAFAGWLQTQKHLEELLRETARYEAFLLRAADGRVRAALFKLQKRLWIFCARGNVSRWPRDDK